MPVPESMSATGTIDDAIASLRERVAAVTEPIADHGVLAFGLPAIDDRLAAGGLAPGGLNELAGASTTPSISMRPPRAGGLRTSNVLYAETKDDAQLLAMLEDAVRDGSPQR